MQLNSDKVAEEERNGKNVPHGVEVYFFYLHFNSLESVETAPLSGERGGERESETGVGGGLTLRSSLLLNPCSSCW